MTDLRFTDVDWSSWVPRERATLMLIFRDDQVLLIRKKRGLGAGKFNGPGGRIEPGETPLQAAIPLLKDSRLTNNLPELDFGLFHSQPNESCH